MISEDRLMGYMTLALMTVTTVATTYDVIERHKKEKLETVKPNKHKKKKPNKHRRKSKKSKR